MSNFIEEFYSSTDLKEHFTLEQMKQICSSPFSMLKRVMNSYELKEVRFEYFGVFTVSPSKVKYYKQNLINKYEKGGMSEEVFYKKIKVIEAYEDRQKN